jgi:hypothetical protein
MSVKQKVTPHIFFISCHSQVTHVTISCNSTTALSKAQLIQQNLHLCHQPFSTLEHETVVQPSKCCTPSPTATGAQGYAVPQHLCNVIPGYPSNRWNRWVGSGVQGDVTTLPTQILWWSQWCAHLDVAPHCHWEEILLIIFLWDKLNNGKQSDILVFQYSSQSSLSASGQEVYKNDTPHSTRLQLRFHTDSAHLNIFFLVDAMWPHSNDCCLDPHWEWWTQVSFPITVFDQKP